MENYCDDLPPVLLLLFKPTVTKLCDTALSLASYFIDLGVAFRLLLEVCEFSNFDCPN